MTINTNLRNAVIVLAMAGVIYALGSAGAFALSTLVTAIVLGFFAASAWALSRFYVEHRTGIESLGVRRRAILYGALGVAALAVTAVDRFTASGLGTVIWLVLLGCCVYALYAVWRSTKQY